MMASERIKVDTLLGDYRVLPKVQERVSFVKEHLPPANEAWAMKASEGAAQVALRNQAVKYQGNLMYLDILQDPPAVRCKRAFKAGDLVIRLLPRLRARPRAHTLTHAHTYTRLPCRAHARAHTYAHTRSVDSSRGVGRISASSTRVSTGCSADSISLGTIGGYEYFVSSHFCSDDGTDKKVPFVSPFWVVARDKDDDDPNMELTTESESVDVPKMFNTKALAVGDFLQVAPWPRLQPRPAKKPRTT